MGVVGSFVHPTNTNSLQGLTGGGPDTHDGSSLLLGFGGCVRMFVVREEKGLGDALYSVDLKFKVIAVHGLIEGILDDDRLKGSGINVMGEIMDAMMTMHTRGDEGGGSASCLNLVQ